VDLGEEAPTGHGVDRPVEARLLQGQHGAAGAGGNTHDPALHRCERGAPPRPGGLFGEAPLEVLAVHPPGKERARLDRGAALAGPLEEVAGLVGEGTHDGSRDVQEVGVAARAVGHAPAEPRALLDEQVVEDHGVPPARRPGHLSGPAVDAPVGVYFTLRQECKHLFTEREPLTLM